MCIRTRSVKRTNAKKMRASYADRAIMSMTFPCRECSAHLLCVCTLHRARANAHVSPLLASFCANGHLFSSLHLLSSVLHSFYNIDVTGTTTEVAGDTHANLVFGRVGIALQESQAGHHHARRAVAALQRVFL